MDAAKVTAVLSTMEGGPDSKELRSKAFRSLLPWKAEESGPTEADIRKRLFDFVSKGVLSVSQTGIPSGMQSRAASPRGDSAWPPRDEVEDSGGWP